MIDLIVSVTSLAKRFVFISAISLILSILLSPSLTVRISAGPCTLPDSVAGVPTWYKYLDGDDAGGKCGPTINASEDALPIGLAVFEIMLRFAGVFAVFMVFYGGFKYVLTQGEPDKATGARKTVMNALIGLVIVIVSSSSVAFVAGRLAS